MKISFYCLIFCFFFSVTSFAQNKIEMTLKSSSGETVKYKVDSFYYTIYDRDSTTVAQFYVYLKRRPDKFIFQWRSKRSNLMGGTVKLQNATTGKTEQVFDFKSASLTSLTDTLENGNSTLNIEVKKLIIDDVNITLE